MVILNGEHAVLFCPCWDCTLLQNQPVPRKEIHVEVGPCPCSKCVELQKQQEAAWEVRLQKHIEAVRMVQSLNENTICSVEQLSAIASHFEGNALIQLLVNNTRYFRALAINSQPKK